MSRTGLYLRPRVTPKNPLTTSQTKVRAYLAKSAQTYKSLTTAQVANWEKHVSGITSINPITGKTYHPTAINEFVALSSKFLQVSPSGAIPADPPTSSFAGDTNSLTATAGTGTITFTATAPNAANVKTELLLQPLASKNVKAQKGA